MATKTKTNSGKSSVLYLSDIQSGNKSKKTAVVVTYVLVVLALLAGLFVPLYGNSEVLAERMLIRYLPGIFNASLYGVLGKNLLPDLGGWFLSFEGTGYVLYGFDYLAGLYILYTVLCILGLIMLIPVCAGNSDKNTSVRSALFVEIASILTIAAIFYFILMGYPDLSELGIYYLLIPFGMCLLATIIQSIVTKGGLGVYRLFVFIVAAGSFLLLYDLGVYLKFLAGPLDSLSDLVQSGANAAFVTVGGSNMQGVQAAFSIPTIVDVFKVADTMDMITALLIMIFPMLILFNAFVETWALGVGRKYKYDKDYTKRLPVSNMGHNAFAIIRYIITIVVGAVLILFLLVVNKDYGTPGIYLYLLTAVMLVQLVLAIIRSAVDLKRVADGTVPVENGKGATAFDDDSDFTPAEDETDTDEAESSEYTPEPTAAQDEEELPEDEEESVQPVPATPADDEEEQTEEPEETEETETEEVPLSDETEEEPEQLSIPGTVQLEKEPVKPVQLEKQPLSTVQPAAQQYPLHTTQDGNTVMYTYKAIYSGPTDAFLDTLTDSEKIEFVQIFLEKTKGKLPSMPEYVIGGDNSAFFPAVFVRLNKFRDILSDGLLAKIYKQI